jgi:hypothetical protein
MKNVKLIHFVILLFTVMFSTLSFAQHDHSSHGATHTNQVQQSPNGGVIKELGKYKIEMVADMFLKKDKLRFYLFKRNFKTILNEGVTGTTTIRYHDGKTETEPLQAKGEDFFVTQLKSSDSFQVNVEFIVQGKTVSAVFINNGIENKSTLVYTCSMHPEIESNSPGQCPKCGMNLIPK